MKLPPSLLRFLPWFNLPTAVLIGLLQRTPAVRVVAVAEEMLASSPIGAVLKSVASAVAALGAMNTLAGATPLVPSSGDPGGITVTAGTPVSVGYTVNGTQTPVMSWSVGGSIPPGTNFSGLTTAGTVNIQNLLWAGTPTTAGTYNLTITAWEGANGTQISSNGSLQYQYTIVVSSGGGGGTTAPSFTTQPVSQAGVTGGSATFTVAVSGNPTPAIQWKKDGTNISNATSTTLTLTNLQASDAATYTAVATNSAGSATSNGAVLTVTSSSAPTISVQPEGHTVATGSSVAFGVTASGGGLSYQWKKNGTPVGGATGAQYLLSNAQGGDAGSYTVTVSNGSGSVTSSAAVLNVVSSSDPGRLINVSVRIVSGTGADTLFMGFVTGGSGTSGGKQLLIRGIGPTLGNFGVPNVMADPVLDVIPQGATTPQVTNDDWAGDAGVVGVANAVGAFALPSTTSKDCALVTTLNPGVYSAKVSGKNSTTGTVLAEIYDANPGTYSASTPRLINISARATMANDNPLIAGFVVGGSTAKTLLIRAIGPALIPYGVTGAMPDPNLEIIRSGQSSASYSNDNWGGSTLITSVGNSVGAFALTDGAGKDAVLLVTLDPGVYSAKVTGVNNTSGITLVEVYEVP
ncbi:MAG: immunoglobulin domain-containing protein [Verrucomicrobia bacterium]|nr:immunoglobulin domain-containing protein [Verrucomicrobiota bacterium]